MKKLIASLLLLSFQGCFAAFLAGSGVGVATIGYLKGELVAVENASVTRVYKASKRAIKDLELKLITDEKDALTAKLVAHGVAKKKYTILIKRENSKETELRIRIGTFGDEERSYIVLEKIEAYL